MCRELASALACTVSPEEVAITAIDGNPLLVFGVTKLCMSRMDETVQFPECEASCVVVEDLSNIHVELVLGVDTISSLGGVSVKYNDGELQKVIFSEGTAACASAEALEHPLPYVTVAKEGQDIILSMDDGKVRWRDDEEVLGANLGVEGPPGAAKATGLRYGGI